MSTQNNMPNAYAEATTDSKGGVYDQVAFNAELINDGFDIYNLSRWESVDLVDFAIRFIQIDDAFEWSADDLIDAINDYVHSLIIAKTLDTMNRFKINWEMAFVANCCYRNKQALTDAQAKVLKAHERYLRWVKNSAFDYDTIDCDTDDYEIAFEKILKLKEPVFLETWLSNLGLFTADHIARYIRVATPEACRNALKNVSAYHMLETRITTAIDGRKNVPDYVKYEPDDSLVSVTNEYVAAWFICTMHKVVSIRREWTTKQLKNALSRPAAIDRYAQIDYCSFDDIHEKQCELIDILKDRLARDNATIQLFTDSYMLAEEGIRMNNCMADYWTHDAETLLFRLEADGTAFDVEVSYNDEFADYWQPVQVLEFNNTKTNSCTYWANRIHEICDVYNISVALSKATYIDAVVDEMLRTESDIKTVAYDHETDEIFDRGTLSNCIIGAYKTTCNVVRVDTGEVLVGFMNNIVSPVELPTKEE